METQTTPEPTSAQPTATAAAPSPAQPPAPAPTTATRPAKPQSIGPKKPVAAITVTVIFFVVLAVIAYYAYTKSN